MAPRGLEVGLRDQVLRMAVTRPDAPDRCLRQLAAAPVAGADRGDPPAVRGPRRSAPRLLPTTRRELTHRPTADVDEVDVAAPGEVRVRVAVRDEGDLPAVRRPLRIGVVVVAAGQELGGAALGVDQPDAREPLVDEARAVELVAQRVDESRVGRGAILRLALGLSFGLRRVGGADDRQPAAVRRPVETLDVLRQLGQLARLAARGEGKDPDLRATLLRRLRLARLRATAAGLEHGTAVTQECDPRAVRRPSRSRVAPAADGQLPRRSAAVGRSQPQRAAIAVLAGSDALDAEDDEAAVRRQVEVGGNAKVVEILGARGAGHRRSVPRSEGSRASLVK